MAIFTNQASLTYNNVVTNSNVATGQIVEVLTVTKAPIVGQYAPGDDMTFAISLVNAGPAALTGLTVNDDLGGYAFGENETRYPLEYVDNSVKYYVNGVLQPAPAVTAGPPLTVSGINIPAGGNAMIIYTAAVNEYAPLGNGGTIDNTAEVSGAGRNDPIEAAAQISAAAAPSLSISKSISPASVTENSRLTYTFIIQNYGNTDASATDNAAVRDLFNPVLSDLAVTFNGALWTEGTQYNYDAGTGEFTTVPGQITVPAAVYSQNPDTGVWETVPGSSVLTVTGTV